MEENSLNTNPENTKGSNNVLFVTGVVLFLALVAGVALFARNKKGNDLAQTVPSEEFSEPVSEKESEANSMISPSTMGEETNNTSVTPDVSKDGVQVIEVEAGSFYFKPSTITVKKGSQVKIVLNNKDGIHDFVLEEFNVKTPQITAGKTAEVEFTADKAGSFEYYCSVGNHRQMGMKGTLVVQ